MITSKPAQTDYPILEIISQRWSPLAFSSQPVEDAKLMSVFEASRWAPSSFNDQPWRYVVGHYGDANHAKLSECLVEGNGWAKNAGVLILSIAKMFFDYNKKENRCAVHDLGAANAYLVLQATALDLITHQMEGFDLERVRRLFKIGEGFVPVSIMAVGYPGKPEDLSEQLQQREKAPRARKKIEDFIWREVS